MGKNTFDRTFEDMTLINKKKNIPNIAIWYFSLFFNEKYLIKHIFLIFNFKNKKRPLTCSKTKNIHATLEMKISESMISPESNKSIRHKSHELQISKKLMVSYHCTHQLRSSKRHYRQNTTQHHTDTLCSFCVQTFVKLRLPESQLSLMKSKTNHSLMLQCTIMQQHTISKME